MGFTSHRGLRRVASFRPYTSKQVGDTGPVESARRSNSRALGSPFSGAHGTVKTVTSHKCGTGREQPNSSGICARKNWAAPPRNLTAGDQLYATNSVLPESRAASASHAANSVLRESRSASASHATNSVLPESRAASASHAANSVLRENQAASASHATKSALEQTSGQQCLRSRRALGAAGGVEHSRCALAGLARRKVGAQYERRSEECGGI